MSARPATLKVSDGGDGHFPRYVAAHTTIDADTRRLTSSVRTRLRGVMPRAGRPLFALLGRPTSVAINGSDVPFVAARDATLAGGVWAADAVVEGRFELEVRNASPSLIAEGPTGFELRVHMIDLGDSATYWDAVGAAGFLHDAYPLGVTLAIHGSADRFRLFSNGDVATLNQNRWRIQHPRWFSPACPFLQALPEHTFGIRAGARAGVATRVVVPHDVDADPEEELARVHSTLAELRRRFGRWPHPRCHVSLVQAGGMEHAGAFFSSSRDLRHELSHGYFGRWVLPVDGPSGWLDEAIAQWFQLAPEPLPPSTRLRSSDMGNPLPWRRGNGPGAYTDGVRLLCALDGALRANGLELDTLLRALVETFGSRHISTAQFEACVERLLPDERAWLQRTFLRALHAGA